MENTDSAHPTLEGDNKKKFLDHFKDEINDSLCLSKEGMLKIRE